MFAYKLKKEKILKRVPKNLRLTSLIPLSSNFKLSQGLELDIIYHLVASGPYSSIILKGSGALPSLLDIF